MDVTNSRILVTGGAGFVGSHLSTQLLEAGCSVHVVDDLSVGREELVPEAADFHQVDIRSKAFRDVVCASRPDAIVHLAAIHYIPYCNEHPEEAFDVNVMGTRNVLDVSRELSGLEMIVFASTAAVYPPGDTAHHEDDDLGPTDIYGKTKLIDEDLLDLFAREDVPIAAARLFNVYGENETNDHLIPAILSQLRNGNREIELGNLSPARDFVHVNDVTRALVSMLRDFEGGFRAFNVGTGTSFSVGEVVERTAEAIGEDIEIVQDEERVRESDRPNLCADVTRVNDELDWEASVDLVDGLRDLVSDEIARG